MYDWNESSPSKGEYIANRTHWMETGTPVQICGGNQALPGNQYASNPTYLYYTEKVGEISIPNVNTGKVMVNGPAYIETFLDMDQNDGGNYITRYHITEVFAHTNRICSGSWTSAGTLLDVVAGKELLGASNIYCYGHDGVHIKKCDLFQNESEFLDYCANELGEISSDDGPTAEQKAKAKQILDDHAYMIGGGWLYIYYETPVGKNKYIHVCIINPSETYKNYWGCYHRYFNKTAELQNCERLFSDRTIIYPQDLNTHDYYNPITDKSHYQMFSVPVQPEWAWVYNSSSGERPEYVGNSWSDYEFSSTMYNQKLTGTWADIGQLTGLGTFTPVIYHRLDIRYMPAEIQKMMSDISKYIASQSSGPIAM